MAKILVTYFSASGVTAKQAKTLASALGADLYEIKPETPYSAADLDYMNKQSRSTIEMHNAAFRPPLADLEANVKAYDVIFVGFPIWWYIAPTIINTFLESYDFSGKTIVPFATSGGSGFGKTMEMLRPSASNTAIWKAPKLLNGAVSGAVVSQWLEELRQ